MQSEQTNLTGATDAILDLSGTGPLHERLSAQLREAIVQGRMDIGLVLPPSRRLAEELGCSRWVVTEAYGQLVAEGYLEARPGSVTRVRTNGHHLRASQRPSPAVTPVRHDLAPGLPDLRAFPARVWANALAAESRRITPTELTFPAPGGQPRLKAALRSMLAPVRGVSAAESDIIVTTSVTEATRAVGRALAKLGITRMAVEDPGWPSLRSALRSAGIETVPIPVDEGGIEVERLFDHPDLRGALVTPAHQFPMGWPMAPDRRVMLLDWASKVDGVVLEDDYDSEFRYDRRPVRALQGMNPHRVVIMKSLSKTLSPALGIGWAVAPAWLREALDDQPPTQPSVIDQLAFARLLEDGSYLRHLRRLLPAYGRARRRS